MPDIYLPTLHPGQVKAYMTPGRFKVIRCGRRWGKTDLAKTITGDGVAKGQSIGWFTPDYRIQAEAFTELEDLLTPIKKNSSKVDKVFRATNGGRIDFWTLENERAGRSRKYHKVIIDEAAFTKANMLHIWETAIRPALLDFRGSAYVLSTPNGIAEDNFFHSICTDPTLGFTEFHAPTHQNPYLPKSELAKLKRDNHPLVYKQEYGAEFVDWRGVQFFELAKMLDEDGLPVAMPLHVDTVFAVIDSAVKDGAQHDGTAVSYYARTKLHGYPLVLLDWDVIQIQGNLLETWLPTVYARLEELATHTKARFGSSGAFIEDKASGTILLQQAIARGWQAHPIDSKLTAAGKDGRALSVSGYVYQGLFKISQYAYDKVVQFKGITRNHWLTQVLGFRIGDPEAYKRADDLADTFTYGLSIALGNPEGY